MLPPGLVSNLQEVLLNRRGNDDEGERQESTEPSTSASADVTAASDETDTSKPLLLVTNADGIESPGLIRLVEALESQGLYNVHVCAPQSWVSFQLFFAPCYLFL